MKKLRVVVENEVRPIEMKHQVAWLATVCCLSKCIASDSVSSLFDAAFIMCRGFVFGNGFVIYKFICVLSSFTLIGFLFLCLSASESNLSTPSLVA